MPFDSVQNLAFQRSQLNSVPSTGIRPTDPAMTPMAGLAANNPFLITSTVGSQANRQVGVNKPFYKPMFLGYKDDQALYGGARLFVLA